MDRLLNTREGNILISILWGLGLAFLFFKQACVGDCIVLSAPRLDETGNNVFSQEDSCYNYKTYPVNCNSVKGEAPLQQKK